VVTEITPDNISYVKKLMEVSEVRHLAGVKCNFGIVDRKVGLFHSISQRPTTVHDAISPISPTAIVISFFRNWKERLWKLKTIDWKNIKIRELALERDKWSLW